MQRIELGDYLLCYLTGVSRFIGVLEATSEPYWDETPIWKDEVFPCRLKVEAIATLTPETAVPIFELKEQLTIFQNLKSPGAWTGHVVMFVALQQHGSLLMGKQSFMRLWKQWRIPLSVR